MKPTLALPLLSLLLGSTLLTPIPAFARDRVTVGFSVTSGPAWGNRSCSPGFRSYGPAYSRSYPYAPFSRSRYPVYNPPCPPQVVAVPRAPVYYAPPAYAVPSYHAPTYVVPMASSAVQIVSGDSTVLQIQSALRERRYYRGALDGLSGPETRSAIRAYQLDRDLPVTGQIDSTLLNELLR